MASRQEILAAVIDIVRSHRPEAGEVGEASRFDEDLAVDSATAMDLVMEIEDRYDLDIPLNALADLRTVGDLADLVHRLLAERGA